MVVIENGDLVMDDGASITATRVTFVLTSDKNGASASSQIQFPTGNGKKAATLALSPSTDPNNPWHGVSIYQDPGLTAGVDQDWKAGVTLNLSGLVYMPKANVTLRGNSSNANTSTSCAKYVVNTFTVDGSVDLVLSHTAQGCSTLQVDQWSEVTVRLAG